MQIFVVLLESRQTSMFIYEKKFVPRYSSLNVRSLFEAEFEQATRAALPVRTCFEQIEHPVYVYDYKYTFVRLFVCLFVFMSVRLNEQFQDRTATASENYKITETFNLEFIINTNNSTFSSS